MSRIVKIFGTLRNHWKKSLFFTGLAAYGSYWGHGKEFNLMRAYCQEAVRYGEQKLSPLSPARHVTVILNPVSNKKGSKSDYEKYCAPLLNLAGLKVSLVVTEAEGQAEQLMSIMDNTDCVLVAGGDGTVHEAITGLLRRSDSDTISSKIPMGIVPLGKNNYVAYQLNRNTFDRKDMKAKVLGESTMALIREVVNEEDVMQVEGELGRPTYSLGHLHIGQIRNTAHRLDEYWYLGQRMKPYLTFFFQSFKNLSQMWDETKPVEIAYTEPCSGCSKCYVRFAPETQQLSLETEDNASKQKASNKRWWHSFIPRSTPTAQPPDQKVLELERMKNTINEKCDQWHRLNVLAKNLMVCRRTDCSKLEMIIHPPTLKRSQFISEGIRILNDQPYKSTDETPFQVIEAKEFHIKLPYTEDKSDKISEWEHSEHSAPLSSKTIWENVDSKNRPSAIKELDQEELVLVASSMEGNKSTESSSNNNEQELIANSKWLSIDNECYEYQSTLRINLLPHRVQIYHTR